jgi:hypothetical protein
MTPSRAKNAFAMILGIRLSSTKTTNHTGPIRHAGGARCLRDRIPRSRLWAGLRNPMSAVAALSS